MNTRIRPTLLPVIQIGLRLLKSFKAQALQRRFLRMPNTTFHFSLSIRMTDATWQRHSAVVPEHVAIQRVERGVVYVGSENSFAQIIEDNYASDATQPAKCLFVQFGPRLRAGSKDQQAN